MVPCLADRAAGDRRRRRRRRNPRQPARAGRAPGDARSALTGDNLILTSDKLRGLVEARGRPAHRRLCGRVLNGGMRTYTIPGFGVVDVLTELRAVPGPGGRGTLVTGTARAWVRRIDNRFLAWVVGRAAAARHEPDARARQDRPFHQSADHRAEHHARRHRPAGGPTAPSSSRAAGGTAITGRCGSTLDGRLERPRLAVRLERPMDALGLSERAAQPRSQRRGLRLARRGRLDAWAVHRQRPDPAAARRAGDDPVRAAQRLGDSGERRAALRSGRVHRHARGRRRRARRAAPVQSGERAPADRGRTSPPTMRASPGRRRSPYGGGRSRA